MVEATKYYWVDVKPLALAIYIGAHNPQAKQPYYIKNHYTENLLKSISQSLAKDIPSSDKECTELFSAQFVLLDSEQIPENQVVVGLKPNEDLNADGRQSYSVSKVIVMSKDGGQNILPESFPPELKNMTVYAAPAVQDQAAEKRLRKRDIVKSFASSGLSLFKAKEPAPKTPSGPTKTQQDLQNFVNRV